MGDMLTAIGGGLAFTLFAMFFILLNRFLKHATDYESSNPKNLGKQTKYVLNMLCLNDKKLILTSFGVSWILFTIVIFAIASDSAWVGDLVKIIDKFGDFLMKMEK